MSRAAVLTEAKEWLGTPFHHMAQVKGAGVDCAQFLIGVFHAVGAVPKVEPGYYPHDWHFHRSEEQYLRWVARYARKVSTPQPGDIALFRFGRCVSHAAIVVEWPLVIHSYFGQGVVYADAKGAELGGRLDSFWTIEGLE